MKQTYSTLGHQVDDAEVAPAPFGTLRAHQGRDADQELAHV